MQDLSQGASEWWLTAVRSDGTERSDLIAPGDTGGDQKRTDLVQRHQLYKCLVQAVGYDSEAHFGAGQWSLA